MTESNSNAPVGSSSPDSGSGNTEVAASTENVSESTSEASEPKSSPRVYKVKIDGQEEEVNIDDRADELLAAYSKVKASNKKFEEAAAERKAAEKERQEAKAMIDRMKSDPWSVMKELGLDPRTTSEEYLIKQLELEAMTPEQKKAMEMEKKLKDYEEREQLTKKEQEEKIKMEEEAKAAERIAQKSQAFAKEYSDQTLEALQSSKLPRSQKVVAEVAKKMLEAAEDGYEMTPKQAVKLVEKEHMAALSSLLKDAYPDLLASLLGDEAMKKLRKRDVEKLKNPAPKAPSKEESPKQQDKKDPYVDPYEWRRELLRKHGGA